MTYNTACKVLLREVIVDLMIPSDNFWGFSFKNLLS